LHDRRDGFTPVKKASFWRAESAPILRSNTLWGAANKLAMASQAKRPLGIAWIVCHETASSAPPIQGMCQRAAYGNYVTVKEAGGSVTDRTAAPRRSPKADLRGNEFIHREALSLIHL
jgi:hypothetical protein